MANSADPDQLAEEANWSGATLCKGTVYPGSAGQRLWKVYIWAQVYFNFFMLNSDEHEICPANKSQTTNNCKFFLAKHSQAWKFLC